MRLLVCSSYDHADERAEGQREIERVSHMIENKSGKRKWKERETNKNNIAKMSRPRQPLLSQQLAAGDRYGYVRILRYASNQPTNRPTDKINMRLQRQPTFSCLQTVKVNTQAHRATQYSTDYTQHIWCLRKTKNNKQSKRIKNEENKGKRIKYRNN